MAQKHETTGASYKKISSSELCKSKNYCHLKINFNNKAIINYYIFGNSRLMHMHFRVVVVSLYALLKLVMLATRWTHFACVRCKL